MTLTDREPTTEQGQTQTQQDPLLPHERARLDGQFKSAKRWYYIAAGAALATFVGNSAAINKVFAIGSVTREVALLCGLLISVVASLFAYHYTKMGITLDRTYPSKTPYPWIVLGREPSRLRVVLWIFSPVPVSALAYGYHLDLGWGVLALLFWVAMLLLLPNGFSRHLKLILERSDERGGQATLSIHSLNYWRLLRLSAMPLMFVSPVAFGVTLPTPVVAFAGVVMSLLTVGFVLRCLGGFVYRHIDKWGARWGFPVQSPHYS